MHLDRQGPDSHPFGVGRELRHVVGVARRGRRPLGGGTSSLAGSENLVVVVFGGQTEADLQAGTTDNPLQGGDGRFAVAAFDASDLRLGHPDSLGQLPLGQTSFLARHQYQPCSHGLRCLAHIIMITDKLLVGKFDMR
jgi:hypothetical protein